MTHTPAEFTGLARQFLRSAHEEHTITAKPLGALLRPVRTRLERYPWRCMRDGDLRRLAASWEALEPHVFRVGFYTDICKRGRSGEIIEVIACPGKLKSLEWKDAAPEPGIVLQAYCVRAPWKDDEQLWTLATVGLHALARRYQRCRDRSHAAVVADLRALVEADIHDDETYPVGKQFEIAAGTGFWVGVKTSVIVKSERWVQFVVRTFLSADDWRFRLT